MKISEASVKLCPFLEEQGFCYTTGCMMWKSTLTSEKVTNKAGEDPPAGDGWKAVSKQQLAQVTGETLYKTSWIRWISTDSGDCGLKSKELKVMSDE